MQSDNSSNGPRASMGLLVAGSEMVSFTLVGLLLDYLVGTLPVLTIVLTLLGVAAAFFQLITMAKALARKKPPAGPDTRN